jgi:hypothetical protein
VGKNRIKTDSIASRRGEVFNMNYSALSLVELKQQAKGRRIKQYYIMKRHQLIQLLSLPELPKSLVIEKLTIVQLRKEAKERGMQGFWGLSRGELLEVLYPSSAPLAKEDEKYRADADKQQSPYDSDPN